MSKPRNLYPDTTLYVTCRCVHRSFRLVPTKRVNRVVQYAFAVVSQRYREAGLIEIYEFEVLSNHYHMLVYDRFGQICDFLQAVNSIIARCLNSVHGASGTFFEDEPGIQTILGDERVLEHSVYTLANAVAAGIVHKAAHWKGVNSLRMEYGKEYEVSKPKLGIWATKLQHRTRKGSRRSGRAAFAGRSKLPEKAVLVLDRPPIMPELSDAELRMKIREALGEREEEIAKARGDRPVMGMKSARKVRWSYTPERGEEMFCRRPTFSTQTREQRRRMKQVRRSFLREYSAALKRWNAGERDVVFPAGTVRMRLRHNALTEPVPLDLLLAA